MRDLSTLWAVESLQKLAPEKFASDSRVVFDKNHGSHFFRKCVAQTNLLKIRWRFSLNRPKDSAFITLHERRTHE